MRKALETTLATWLTSEKTQRLTRRYHRLKASVAGQSNEVVFYHRVGDAWSWLAAQMLNEIANAHGVSLRIRVVAALPYHATPDPQRYDDYAAYDAHRLADAWGLRYPAACRRPGVGTERLATRIILASPTIEIVLDATKAAWLGDESALTQLASQVGAVTEPQADTTLAGNLAELQRRGHYLSAMAWYEGEWYWGVDRMHFLERRLASEQRVTTDRFTPLPRDRAGSPQPQTLEFYFSFRSPYSYLAVAPVLTLADRLGLDLQLHPVLPMIARGMAVSWDKRRYILTDAARVARQQRIAFGPVRDPAGQAVERCLAVLYAARDHGAGRAFLVAAMRAIWTRAAALESDSPMHAVAAEAGLSAETVNKAVSSRQWRAAAEANAARLSVLGLWGVPALCLRGFDQQPVSVAWGQDRVWAIERAALGIDRPVALPGVKEQPVLGK